MMAKPNPVLEQLAALSVRAAHRRCKVAMALSNQPLEIAAALVEALQDRSTYSSVDLQKIIHQLSPVGLGVVKLHRSQKCSCFQ